MQPLLILLVFLTGCSSTPDTWSKMPKRAIYRPYTLPKGLNSWQSAFKFSFDQEVQEDLLEGESPGDLSSKNEEIRFLYIPLWEQGVSDRLTLLWPLFLPLGFRYQVLKDEKNLLGTQALLRGIGYSSLRGVGGIYNFELDYRRTFSKRWALRLRGTINDEFGGLFSDVNFDRRISVSAMYQWKERLLLESGFALRYFNRFIDFVDSDGFFTSEQELKERDLPFFLGVQWTFSNYWETRATYTYEGLSDSIDEQSFSLNF